MLSPGVVSTLVWLYVCTSKFFCRFFKGDNFCDYIGLNSFIQELAAICSETRVKMTKLLSLCIDTALRL